MDTILKHPLFQAGVISVCCYFLAFITRRAFEAGFSCLKVTADPKKPYATKMSEWWNTVILYAIPVLYGNVVCLLLRKTTFFPEGYQSWQAAMVLGTALGFMSGFFYKVLKRLIMREAGVEKEDDLPVANVPDPPGTKP
jgi:hypothetical protein